MDREYFAEIINPKQQTISGNHTISTCYTKEFPRLYLLINAGVNYQLCGAGNITYETCIDAVEFLSEAILAIEKSTGPSNRKEQHQTDGVAKKSACSIITS